MLCRVTTLAHKIDKRDKLSSQALRGRKASEAALIEWDSDGKAKILCY